MCSYRSQDLHDWMEQNLKIKVQCMLQAIPSMHKAMPQVFPFGPQHNPWSQGVPAPPFYMSLNHFLPNGDISKELLSLFLNCKQDFRRAAPSSYGWITDGENCWQDVVLGCEICRTRQSIHVLAVPTLISGGVGNSGQWLASRSDRQHKGLRNYPTTATPKLMAFQPPSFCQDL